MAAEYADIFAEARADHNDYQWPMWPLLNAPRPGATIHLAALDTETHFYMIRSKKEDLACLKNCGSLTNIFEGTWQELLRSDHPSRYHAFRVDVLRRDIMGSRTRLTVSLANVLPGDEVATDARPAGLFCGDNVGKIIGAEEVLSHLGIQNSSPANHYHASGHVLYIAVSGFSIEKLQRKIIELDESTHWVPIDLLPNEITFPMYDYEYNMTNWLPPISGVFAVNLGDGNLSPAVIDGRVQDPVADRSRESVRRINAFLAYTNLLLGLNPQVIAELVLSTSANGTVSTRLSRRMQTYNNSQYGSRVYPSDRMDISGDRFVRVATTCFSKPKRGSRLARIQTSLRHAEAALRNQDPIISLPGFWAAIEQLLNPGQNEISHKLAVALTAFVFEKSQRDQAFDAIKRAYAFRSKIAHGADFDETELSIHGQVAVDMYQRALSESLNLCETDKGNDTDLYRLLTLRAICG